MLFKKLFQVLVLGGAVVGAAAAAGCAQANQRAPAPEAAASAAEK